MLTRGVETLSPELGFLQWRNEWGCNGVSVMEMLLRRGGCHGTWPTWSFTFSSPTRWVNESQESMVATLVRCNYCNGGTNLLQLLRLKCCRFVWCCCDYCLGCRMKIFPLLLQCSGEMHCKCVMVAKRNGGDSALKWWHVCDWCSWFAQFVKRKRKLRCCNGCSDVVSGFHGCLGKLTMEGRWLPTWGWWKRRKISVRVPFVRWKKMMTW